MKEIKSLPLAFAYTGCFLGAGFVSGQELWQFFGSFGNWGYLGFLVAAILFVFFGILLLRITQMTGIEDLDQLIVPWDIPWLRKVSGAIAALFLLGVVIIMTAGVGAMLDQLLGLPAWIGDGLFVLLIALIAMAGVSGMVNAFSALVPLLVLATILFAGAAFWKFGTGDIFHLTNVNTNPLMPNWLIAALTYVAYNILGAIGIITPLGKLIRRRSTIYAGITLGGFMLIGVAGSVLASLAVCLPATEAELPMVALGSSLSPLLGKIYGILLLLGMFCNALASLVGLLFYLEQKKPSLQTHRKLLLAIAALLIWVGSLGGFGQLVGIIFPVFGYISIFFLVGLILRYVHCRQSQKTTSTQG